MSQGAWCWHCRVVGWIGWKLLQSRMRTGTSVRDCWASRCTELNAEYASNGSAPLRAVEDNAVPAVSHHDVSAEELD